MIIMNNIRTICFLIVFSIFTFVSSAVHAQDRDRNNNFFLTLGRTFVKEPDFKDEMTALKFGTGYRISPYMGMELFYIYYGAISERDGPNVSARFTAGALVLNAIGIIPLGSLFEMYGKVGYSSWRFELELNNTPTDSAKGSDPVFSLGFGYKIDYDSTLRLEYELSDYDDTEFSVISFGFQHNF